MEHKVKQQLNHARTRNSWIARRILGTVQRRIRRYEENLLQHRNHGKDLAPPPSRLLLHLKAFAQQERWQLCSTSAAGPLQKRQAKNHA